MCASRTRRMRRVPGGRMRPPAGRHMCRPEQHERQKIARAIKIAAMITANTAITYSSRRNISASERNGFIIAQMMYTVV